MKEPTALNPKHSEPRVWIPKNRDYVKTLERKYIGKILQVFWVNPKWSKEDGELIIDGCYRTWTLEWRAWVPDLHRYVPAEELVTTKHYQDKGPL